MRLKVYRAPSMAEAMARLRHELGADALILSARTLRDGVELTAGLDPDDEPPLPVPAVNDALVRGIAAHHGIPEQISRHMARGTLAESLARVVSFGSIDVPAGPLLFVGAPGAGKTSTVARLATRLVLAGERPMVITADGRRAGATEQLAAYTRLLGLNLVVATHPVTLGRALTRREPAAPVLIDAPGCDYNDPVQLQELVALAATAEARMVLVLPAGLDTREAADIAIAHARIGVRMLVANRLDLSRRLGSVLGASAAGNLALVEAGIGPGAADGLVMLTPELLADRLQRDLPVPPKRQTYLSEARS